MSNTLRFNPRREQSTRPLRQQLCSHSKITPTIKLINPFRELRSPDHVLND